MPEAKVYLCDKTEGLPGQHLKCGKAVEDGSPDGVFLSLTIAATGDGKGGPNMDLRFCRRRHANYWLIRQRVTRES